jgi:alkylation response protein AidB-like acyl-CoA dehydrogenase
MAKPSLISSPDDSTLEELCSYLAGKSGDLDCNPHWPAEQLRRCGEAGVFQWFLDPAWGGQGWNEEQVVRGYLALSKACLTTTFIITQRTGACRRIAGSANEALKARLLPPLASGEGFATVGISHLTTSRRHLGKPALVASRTPGGFQLDGFSPWVTGAAAADTLVLGATLFENGAATDRELLLAVPSDLPGVEVQQPLPLVGVSASCTGAVNLNSAHASEEWLLAGPVPHVMMSGVGAGTGGHETSTLAIGGAQAAINFLSDEARRRQDLSQPVDAFRDELRVLRNDLLAIATGHEVCSKESLRQRANSLVLRASQAALAAAKGSGYVVGHPAGRWCREALFFLVWSCPQPVASANMCELAGIED